MAVAYAVPPEPGLDEIIARYPLVSPFVILKTDVQRRGVRYTAAAQAAVDPSLHQVLYQGFSIEKQDQNPMSLILRDGTSILISEGPNRRPPYVVDVVDGKTVLTDQGRVIEEVEYWHKPAYYDQTTTSGKPMWTVAAARPQRIDFNPYQYCQFWTNGQGCKYCNIAANFNQNKDQKPAFLDLEDIAETARVALGQPGRFTSVFLTGGSLLSGAELLDDEVDLYIRVLQAIGRSLNPEKFPSQLIATAFNERQLARLYEQTGLSSYTADIEVLNEDLFGWICPGKAKKIGYREWKRRLVAAVDIFGPGNVNTGIVGGVELAQPRGFPSEADALKATLEEAEDLASQGVSTVYCVWNVAPGSVFQDQLSPSLDYYVQLAVGLDALRRKYNLSIDMDNYRRCGNHPDSDLSRVWQPVAGTL